MAEKPTPNGFRYLDFVAMATGTLVAAGLLAVPSVGLIWAGFIALRRRAYRQAAPWFVLSLSTLFAIVIVVAFWPAPLMWFALAAPAGAMLLLVGLIAPTKRLGEA